jgi:site-specific DNA-methyltransferase (adenine-specific)
MTQVHFIPLTSIIVPLDTERTRPLSLSAATELRSSIESVGLLQPIIVHVVDGAYTLVAGKHRWTAFDMYYKQADEGLLQFLGQPIPFGHIPALFLLEHPELILEMEIAENIYRAELPWKDRVLLLAKITRQEQSAIPSVTMTAIAEKIARSTGAKTGTIQKQIARANIIAAHLDDPDVRKAESVQGAMNVVEAKARRELQGLILGTVITETSPTIHTFHAGDCREIMKELPDNHFDLILSDPPYGINAGSWEQGVNEHTYADDPKTSQSIYFSICHQGYRLAADLANMFLFCDIGSFERTRRFAEQAGWVVWPSPIIWKKSNEGMAPWGRKGPIKVYEAILFATKGQKGLHTGCIDVLSFQRPSRSDRIHAAQKPVELLTHLITISSRPGDKILDPCCGSGSIFTAGWELHCPVTGLELDPAFIPTIHAAMEEKPAVKPLAISSISVQHPMSVEDLFE